MISGLPPVRAFYESEVGPFKTRPSRAGWAPNRCPFHQSKSGRSFSVHLESGSFFCFGCGAKGGDIVSFVRLRYKLSFRDALKHLGIDQRPTVTPPTRKAWRPKSPARLLAEAVVDGPPENPERAERIRLRDEIHATAAIFGKAAQRFSELQRGALESYADEREDCWAVMDLAFSDLRETERDYMFASGFRECEMP